MIVAAIAANSWYRSRSPSRPRSRVCPGRDPELAQHRELGWELTGRGVEPGNEGLDDLDQRLVLTGRVGVASPEQHRRLGGRGAPG